MPAALSTISSISNISIRTSSSDRSSTVLIVVATTHTKAVAQQKTNNVLLVSDLDTTPSIAGPVNLTKVQHHMVEATTTDATATIVLMSDKSTSVMTTTNAEHGR